MSKVYKITRGEVAKGSPLDVASKSKSGLTDVLYQHVALLAIVDTSGSMLGTDTPEGISREAKAIGQLKELYQSFEGNILLVEFSNDVEIRVGGDTRGMHMSTDLAKALRFVREELKADHPKNKIRIVLISDGQPNSETEAFREAEQFKKPINVIYCGPGNDEFGGQVFLEELAHRTGGVYQQTPDVADLEMQVAGLLTDGGT